MALASYITSVQHFNITLAAGVASNSANLAAGTDETKCVPFHSWQTNYTTDYHNRIDCDVYFTAGSPPTITVARGYGDPTYTMNVSVFVVEFDGTNVKVQQGTFTMSSPDLSDQDVISSVALTKTACIIAWKYMSSNDDWDDAMVRCYFSDATHIDFVRQAATTGVAGHYFIFEANGTEFTVEAKNFSITSGTQGTVVITSVTMGRTMVVGSFESHEIADDTHQGSCTVWLYDSTHVYAECGSAGSGIDITAFIIEFNATDGVDVQRGDFNMGSAALTDTDDITAVTQANAIINMPSGGYAKSDSSANADVPASLVEINFTDSDTVDGERGNHAGSIVQNYWEVIDFTYGAPPPTAYSGWGINRGINRGIL